MRKLMECEREILTQYGWEHEISCDRCGNTLFASGDWVESPWIVGGLLTSGLDPRKILCARCAQEAPNG